MPHVPQRTTTQEAILRHLLTNPTEQRGSRLEAALHLSSGALYPALSDLEKQLCLTGRDETPGGAAADRLYRLTDSGTATAEQVPPLNPAEAKAAVKTAKRSTKKRKTQRKWTNPIWSVLGLCVFFIPGVITGTHQIMFQAHSVATPATVVGSVSYRDTGKGACPHETAYYAVRGHEKLTIDGHESDHWWPRI